MSHEKPCNFLRVIKTKSAKQNPLFLRPTSSTAPLQSEGSQHSSVLSQRGMSTIGFSSFALSHGRCKTPNVFGQLPQFLQQLKRPVSYKTKDFFKSRRLNKNTSSPIFLPCVPTPLLFSV